MSRYVCVHGHFYQPPRENAWLEDIEQQESAYPYHDWNERITAECYGPNAHARILDRHDRIIRIANNYASMSFNFGPTLLVWMERYAHDIYERVLQADRVSIARFGFGSALAQAYNHMIMPLASERDRGTQVRWGMRDFEYRFGRRPEGMWLPETAVDTPTLEALAAGGIRFTILAPRQAAAVRDVDGTVWTDVSGGRIDPLQPYLCRLPSGRTIVVFFYDGPTSQAVAFEGLLGSGERFADRLTGLAAARSDGAVLAHIATDGETYGHHHRHGEMALAWALREIDENRSARLTNYAAFLAAHPPTREVRIVERSSWSCVHGVERWRSDCGCHTGGRPGWNQAWRAPLRDTLDWLRDVLAPRFESAAGDLTRDPWVARDAYIDVVLDRSAASIDRFIQAHAARALDRREIVRLLKLLEMQRNAMLMFTSCGWFFNDVSGIETVQVLQYAARATQLAEEVFGDDLEPALMSRLQAAKSNVPAARDGRHIYETRVRPLRVDLFQVAAHRAVSALFDGGDPAGRVYCYDVDTLRHESRTSEGATVTVGRATVTSRLTLEAETMSYAVLHFGNHQVSGGIRRHEDEQEHARRSKELLDAFAGGDLARVVALLADFPDYAFSLKSLFADRQREILHRLLDARVDAADLAYRQVYSANADLMRYLMELELPVPRALTMAAEFVLNRDLRHAFAATAPDLDRIRSLLDSVRALGTPLDQEGLAFAAQRSLAALVEKLQADPTDTERLQTLAGLASLVRSLPFDVDLWSAQNGFYEILERELGPMQQRAADGDPAAEEWIRIFRVVGDQLAVATP